jgi:uncharacterized protein (TIGR02246 family)
MLTRQLRYFSLSFLMFTLTALRVLAGPQDDNADAKAAIAKNGEAFIEAFHKGDAKALAAFWTEDGDYTDQNGHHMKGRAAIEKTFGEHFGQHPGLKLRINSESLRFVTPDVAIEDGSTEVFAAEDAPPSRARYTIVHVKKDGQWLLSSVRDSVFTPAGNHAHLSGLAGFVGDWAEETSKPEVERLSVSWAEGENFLVATFANTVKDATVGSATQWIGWDPAAKRIRSWIFDASGGFGEGAWSGDGKKWTIKTSSLLQDGKKAAATLIVTLVDADTITLQAKDRSVAGKGVPDTNEAKLKRVK